MDKMTITHTEDIITTLKSSTPVMGKGQTGASSHGLLSGTHVASNLGWRTVDTLAVGDKVLTFDNAMQTVVEIRRDIMWVTDSHEMPRSWPVVVPQGALGNRCDMTILPDQGIMIECDAAEDAHGDPFAVIPAMVMEGLRGIYRTPPTHPIEIVTLFFAQEQVIYVEGGLLMYCPKASCLVSDQAPSAGAYDVLSLPDAVFLVECMMFEDQMVARSKLHGAGQIHTAVA
jgi:hypothetical protein